MNNLHSNKNCSQFIHDVLNVIEKEMLVVLSEHKKRSSSGVLRGKFEHFYSRCMDPQDQDYCTKGAPVPLPKVFKAATGVGVILNETAQKLMEDYPLDIETEIHTERIRESMKPEDLAKIDEL